MDKVLRECRGNIPKVVIINGFPESGKDSFVQACKDFYPKTFNYHTSNKVKGLLMNLGWNGTKTPNARKLLADLLAFSYKTGQPFKDAQVRADHLVQNEVMFIHCREWDNIVKFKEQFVGAVTLFVNRQLPEIVVSNESDKNAGYNRHLYDFNIYNDGDLEDLQHTALRFMGELLGGNE